MIKRYEMKQNLEDKIRIETIILEIYFGNVETCLKTP